VAVPRRSRLVIKEAERSMAPPRRRRPATGEPGGERPHHTVIDLPPEKPGGARPYLAAVASSPKKPGGAWPRLAAVASPPEEPALALPRLPALATTKGRAEKSTATSQAKRSRASPPPEKPRQCRAARWEPRLATTEEAGKSAVAPRHCLCLYQRSRGRAA
jgi:hypothetical protein